MKLIDRMSSIWAIQPDRLAHLAGVVRAHLTGPKVDIDRDELQKNSSVKYDWSSGRLVADDTEIIDGTGIVHINGVILQRPTLFERYIFDAIGTEDIRTAITGLINDASVERIVLFVNSPGGTVPGVDELAAFIRESRGVKPIIAYTDNLMASAAYWIGSAADKIFISGETTQVGSIGVYCTHYDWSKLMEQIGVTATDIYAGKFKTAGSPNRPLDDDSKAYIQASVDHTYGVFVSAVAKNRGTSPEAVLVNMADGRVFNGSEAIKAGLVDGVSTFDALLGGNSPDTVRNDEPGDGESAPKNQYREEETAMNLTREQLIKENPDLYQQIRNEGVEEGKKAAVSEEALASARKEGAKAELSRIQGIKAAALPGYDNEINAMIADGETTPEQAALKIVGLEKAALEARAGVQVDTLSSGGESAGKGKIEQSASVEERAKAEWDSSSELRAEFPKFEHYLAYKKHEHKEDK